MGSELPTQPAWMPAGRAPGQRRPGLRITIVLAAIGLLAVIGAGAYLSVGVAIAATDRVATDQVIEQARRDNDKVASLVKTPDLQSDVTGNVDYAKARAGMEQSRADITTARATLAADTPRLRRAAARVRTDSASFLLAPERGALDRDRSRLEAVMTAFGAADQALIVADEQLRFSIALTAATEMFDTVGHKLDADDLAGALSTYGQLDAAVQQVVDLAKSQSIPPQLQTLATTLATTAADVKKLIQALQARDSKTARSLEPRLDSDEKALNGFDPNAARAQASQIFDPYRTRYEAALKSAGFTVVAA